MVRMRDELDRLFGDVWDNVALPFSNGNRRSFPALNVWEDETTLFAEAEVPGLKLQDIEVLVVGNELTIRGERKDEAGQETTYHRRERGFGSFCRVLQLPVSVNPEKVEATLSDGVLTIRLPKAEDVLPRKIQVKG